VKFKIDENLPLEFVDLLTGAGYAADTIIHENLGGADDSTIAAVCLKEDRILITLDLDFADIRSYPPQAFPGFLVMRPGQQDKLHLIELLRSVLPLLSVEPVQNRLWIVDESGVRIRGEHA
jgi:predicted nuclease of predicted toxin-antitoxin system